jgi:hypothetical protein
MTYYYYSLIFCKIIKLFAHPQMEKVSQFLEIPKKIEVSTLGSRTKP